MNDLVHMSSFAKRLLSGTEWPSSSPHWVVVKLTEGLAYARCREGNSELAVGGVLVIPPKSAVSLLASVLSEPVFKGFAVKVSSLVGLLTTGERICLEQVAPARCAPYLMLPPTHPLAERMSELTEDGLTLMTRLSLLQTFVQVLSPHLTKAATQPVSENESQPKVRLRQFINQIPESELGELTLQSLAQHLKCCERHTSRLFHEVWGTSFREYVTELRLKKACKLLENTDAKIIDVAIESGHSSLALFNYNFKNRLHMTPTEWRKRFAKPARPSARAKMRLFPALSACWLAAGLALKWLVAPDPVVAAEPSATNCPPAATAPGTNAPSPRFRVERYEAVGNTLIPAARLEQLFAPHTGPAVGLETVRKALQSLQTEYRDRGYPTIGLSLPPQEVTNGVIYVKVTEGVLAEIKVINNHHFSSNNVMRALPGLAWGMHFSGDMLNSKTFQAELDRANANPDRQIYPEVRAGPEPGTSALILDVKDRLPLHGRVEWNNYSPPNTPEQRLNTSLAYANLWQREHTVGFQYGFSPQAYKQNLDIPGLTLTALDQPLISYYSAFYRAPLAGAEMLTGQISRNPGKFGYNEVTHQFVLPPFTGRPELVAYATRSTTDNGLNIGPVEEVIRTDLLTIEQQSAQQQLTSDLDAGLRLNVPETAGWGLQSTWSAGADWKQHGIYTLATNTFFTMAVVTNTSNEAVTNRDVIPVEGNRKTVVDYVPFFLGWSGVLPDPWGSSSGGLSFVGCPGSPFASDNFPAAVGSKSGNGSFVILRPSLSREQKLFSGFTAYVNSGGQWANKPVISTEQFALGGMATVRGYREGESYGDTGWFVQGELRTPTLWAGKLGSSRLFGCGLFGFSDYGESFLVEARSQQTQEALWGAGLGVNIFLGRFFASRLLVGWALKNSQNTNAGEARFSFNLGAQF